ncbi:hypothetical protein GCM10010309_06580 [Streptomyces violaceochromogenes]|nr:hypothetical protein GCM10010309_06580 [Streptomyces violaceochromogenes]
MLASSSTAAEVRKGAQLVAVTQGVTGMTGQRAAERLLHDAVIVVPGIMGSVLRDVKSGKRLWGVRKLFQYSARRHEDRMRALSVSAEERAGDTGRIEATGLLDSVDWLPGLGGAQPYNQLVRELRQAAVDPGAVLPFPYDWRLSVEYNGALLADAARRHLKAWRDHAAHRHHLARHPEAGPARILFVAHSMGGLLVREVLYRGDLRHDIRAVMTVGTPFSGSVKAAVMLNSGKGGPLLLPPAVLRDVAPTMPGLYDLLPAYRALDDGHDTRIPTVDDIVELGGVRELAEATVSWRTTRQDTPLPGHVTVVGLGKKTLQSYRMRAGTAVGQRFMPVRDRGDDRVLLDAERRRRTEDGMGDGTVYQFAARPARGATEPITVFQDHTALARSRTVIDQACGMLRGLSRPDELGAVLGNGTFALDVPEWAEPDAPVAIEVSGWDGSSDLRCTVREVSGRDEVLYPDLTPVPGEEGKLVAACVAGRPGLYEIEVVGGVEPVIQLVLVAAAEQPA